MYKYSSIEQFRTVKKYVDHVARVTQTTKPKIFFEGTVKIHGTNSGVRITKEGIVLAQSRNNVITPDNDNFGFAKFVDHYAQVFRDLFQKDDHDVIVYGEWCGNGIQKGVAVSELEKMWVMFDMYRINDEDHKVWDNSELVAFGNDDDPAINKLRIYSIYQFPTFVVELDFADSIALESAVKDIIEWVELVENKCPVGAFFGVSGVGEGIVFKPTNTPALYNPQELFFKAKGQKHSVSKVKKTVAVDPEKLATIQEFVEYAITENRVKQAMHELGIMDNPKPQQLTGQVIKWVMADVFKEETDVMEENGVDSKMLGKYAPEKIRKLFFTEIEV